MLEIFKKKHRIHHFLKKREESHVLQKENVLEERDRAMAQDRERGRIEETTHSS